MAKPAPKSVPKTASAAVSADLIARFRRQRPLRGGSLIVTIFGDAIMPRGGAIALGSLIELAAPFGLNERLVRTATARLAKDGWLMGRRASTQPSCARRAVAVRTRRSLSPNGTASRINPLNAIAPPRGMMESPKIVTMSDPARCGRWRRKRASNSWAAVVVSMGIFPRIVICRVI